MIPSPRSRPAVLSNNDTSSLSRNTGAEEKSSCLPPKQPQPIQPAQRRRQRDAFNRPTARTKLPEETVGAPHQLHLQTFYALPLWQESITRLPYWCFPIKHRSLYGYRKTIQPMVLHGKPPALKLCGQRDYKWKYRSLFHLSMFILRTRMSKDRFYQPLSPGIWGSITRNRHRITGEFKPFASALLPNKTFQKHMLILPDGTALPGDKKLVKVFGTQAGLQYTFQVNKHWWVRGRRGYIHVAEALILSEGLDSMLNMSRIRGVYKMMPRI